MSQILLHHRACVDCKKMIVVKTLSRKYCQECLIKRTELYRMVENKVRRIKRSHIRSCLVCNYIFMSCAKNRKYCCNACVAKAHRMRSKNARVC